MKTLSIDAYQLGEYSQKVQDAILDGYVFDFDSNENYPTSFGSFYHAVMVKAEEVQETQVQQDNKEVTPEFTQVSKPGRKPKSN